MACLDCSALDLRCMKGIPVTLRFNKFFCKSKHEENRIISLAGGASPTGIYGGKHEMSAFT